MTSFTLPLCDLMIVARELVGRRHHVEPPRPAALGSDFGAMQQVAFADHADYPVVVIDDRNGADAALGQQSGDRRHGGVIADRDYIIRHYVDCAHRGASGLVPCGPSYRTGCFRH